MSKLNNIPKIEDTLVVFSGTIHKTQEDLYTQARFQKNIDNSLSYELISFYNNPVHFHSFVILENGEKVSLKTDEHTLNFESETSLLTEFTDFKIFARVISDNCTKTYKQLHGFGDDGCVFGFQCNKGDEFSENNFVDRILISGSFTSLSYLVFGFKDNKRNFRRWDLLKTNVYYGENILDLNKHIISSESLSESICEGLQKKSETKIDKLKEPKPSNYRTLNDLACYLTINEEYEKIQNLKKTINHLIEDIKSDKQVEACVGLLSKFICNDLLFKEFMDYNTLENLTKLVFNNLEYEPEGKYFKLFKLLIHDSRLARYFVHHLPFEKTLNLLFSDNSSLDRKNCLLNILLIVLSHPYLLSKFVANDSQYKNFSYDNFVYNSASLTLLSSLFYNSLLDIGANLTVYISLSQTESLYLKLKDNKFELSKNFNQDLEKLSLSINSSLDNMKTLEHGNEDLSLNRNKFIRHFLISCINETQFVRSIQLLFNMLYYQLSEFPVLTVDVYSIVHKSFSFIKTYLDYFQFQEPLVVLYNIACLVMKLSEPMELAIRKGFPYVYSSVYTYFDSLAKECHEALLYTRVQSLLSSTVSQGSFDTTIDDLYSLSKEYNNFFDVFNRIVENSQVSNFIVKSLNSYIKLIRDDSRQSLTNKINKNVSILVNLISKSIILDKRYNMMLSIATNFLEFLDFYLPKLSDNSHLDSDLVNSTFLDLYNVYSFTSFTIEPPGKLVVKDVTEFLKLVFKNAGLDFGLMFRTQSEGNMTKSNDKDGETILKRIKGNKSYVDEKVSTVYLNKGSFKMFSKKPLCVSNYKRGKELGMLVETQKYYEKSKLAVLPPEKLPKIVELSLSLLINLAKRGENASRFRKFMELDKCTPLLDVWRYSVSSLMTDFNTLVNSEMGAFSSLVGYSWMENYESFVPVISKSLHLLYISLRHLSFDTLTVNFEDDISTSGTGVFEKDVQESNSFYINDDLLDLLVLTSTTLFNLRTNNFKSDYKILSLLSRFMHYWFNRFKLSKKYILNKLLRAATLLPNLYKGVLFLIVSCQPLTDLRTTLSFKPCASENKENTEDNEGKQDRNDALNTFNFKNKKYRVLENKLEHNQKNLFDRLMERYSTLDTRAMVELLCVLASRCYSVDSASIIASSCVSYFVISNQLPLFDLLEDFLDFEPNDLNSTLRVLVFFSNLLHFCNKDTFKSVEPIYNLNYNFLKYVKKVLNMKELPLFCYPVMFESLLNSYTCHNKLWTRDYQYMIHSRRFERYVSYLVSSITWIFNTLNGTKMDFTSTDLSESLSSDLVSLGLFALCTAFQSSFTTLTVLYSLSESSEFGRCLAPDYYKSNAKTDPRFSSDKEKYDSRSDKQGSRSSSDRDELRINVKYNNMLRINNFLDYLRECTSNPENLLDTSLSNLVFNFFLLMNLFTNVQQTGKAQDVFILHMAQNLSFEEISKLKDVPDLFDTLFFSLDSLLNYLKTRTDLNHLVALLVMVKVELDELKKEILDHPNFNLIRSLRVNSLLSNKTSSWKIFSFTDNFPTSFTHSLLSTAHSYSNWPFWVNLVTPITFELDYNKPEGFLPFTKNGIFEYEQSCPKRHKTLNEVVVNVKEPKQITPAPTPTPEQWSEFDTQLSSNGLDLISLVNNRSILMDKNNRRKFLNVVVRNKHFFNHVIKLGVDIFT